ncbi:MAG: helix-turn-helix transcriptional regulator [Pelagimonas sp.]|uniref:helix-turn-helix transcriptional regulator n=1 Tax=Pelagimonas sp. TaxID=2073170 RepID=UPI003D6A7147
MQRSSKLKKLIRMPEVMSMTGLGRSTIYNKVQAGEFPRPLKISHRHVAWDMHDVLSWIESRPVANASTWLKESPHK